MTRKDYRMLAEAISYLPQCEQKTKLVDILCVVLKRDNPRFNSMIFKSHCYALLNGDWIR